MKMNEETNETPRAAGTLPLLVMGVWALVVWVLGLWKLVELIVLAVRKWVPLVLLLLVVGCAATKPAPAPPRDTAEDVMQLREINELLLSDRARGEAEMSRVLRMSRDEQRRWYLLSQPNHPYRDAIAEQRPALGMSNWDVRMALGNPYRINRMTSEWGTHEQWVYETHSVVWWGPRNVDLIVYLRNDKVVGWQD